jgi:hypothetical protein
MYDCWLYSVPCFWYVCSVYVCLCCVLCKRGTDDGVVLSLHFHAALEHVARPCLTCGSTMTSSIQTAKQTAL